MRRFVPALMLAAVSQATIVDRIAVTVGTKVITDSEISIRIRLTAFENGDKPDFSLESRRKATDRLIDQKIVEREMDDGHYPRTEDAASAALLDNYAETNYGPDREALSRALAGYELTQTDLREDLTRQADLLHFLDLRFRPSIQVSDADVRRYYDEQFRQVEGSGATLNELRTQIEQRIAGDRADAEMEAWLKDQRKRTRIAYIEKELAP
ncbi:MAG TPA: hypothetical protein VKB79_09525 [Bryobacteraceae bacterium]|nr:hypothetical protein [Bryobacteraceae bacterium]